MSDCLTESVMVLSDNDVIFYSHSIFLTVQGRDSNHLGRVNRCLQLATRGQLTQTHGSSRVI